MDRDIRVNDKDLRDIKLQRRVVWDAFCHSGISCDYYPCLEDNKDLYNDPTCVWGDKISVDVTFDDNPKIKVLKDLGWYNEDEEIRSPILYMPIYENYEEETLLTVKNNSLVRVNYFGRNEPAEFRITETRMDSIYGIHWICKLAPEKIRLFETELKNGSYYLKRNEDTSASNELSLGCSHEEEIPSSSATNPLDDYNSMIMGACDD